MAPQKLSLTIDSDPADLALVRRFCTLGASVLEFDVDIDALALLATEVTANAMELKAGTVTITLRLSATESRLLFEVLDYGWGQPVARPLHESALGDQLALVGRGLGIVAHLAAAWGVEQFLPGKIVWFELTSAGTPDLIGVEAVYAN